MSSPVCSRIVATADLPHWVAFMGNQQCLYVLPIAYDIGTHCRPAQPPYLLPLQYRYTEKQRSRLAAIASEQAGLTARQEALRAEVAELGRADRLAGAGEQLGQLQEMLKEADATEAVRAQQLLQELKRVRSEEPGGRVCMDEDWHEKG